MNNAFLSTQQGYGVDDMDMKLQKQFGFQDPLNSFVQGMQAGNAIKQIRDAREVEANQIQQQEALNHAISALWDNPNPNARDFARIASMLPPKEAENLRASWELLGKDRQENELRFGAQVMSAIASDRPDIGIQLLKQRAEAEKNSGREDQANIYDTYAQLAEINPAATHKSIGILLAGLPGGEKVLEGSLNAMKAPSEIAKSEIEAQNLPEKLVLDNLATKSQIRNINDQIDKRAQQLNLDRDKLQSDMEAKLYEFKQKQSESILQPDARKLLNESVVNASAAEQAASRTLELADKLQNLGGGYGALSSATEFFKNATGNEDAWSQARQEYVRLRNSQAIKSLPPGAASDRDIEIALKGFPKENANANTLASFMRGMAKMQQYEAESESAKAEWVNAVGSLGKPKQDIQIGESVVPAGTSYMDFIRESIDKRTGAAKKENAASPASQRSYMRWAQ